LTSHSITLILRGLAWGVYRERGDPERDILAALERWVESGIAPEHLIATTAAPR
jgi:hypothetical protein